MPRNRNTFTSIASTIALARLKIQQLHWLKEAVAHVLPELGKDEIRHEKMGVRRPGSEENG